MILSFSVENYKSIREKATISFEATDDQTDEAAHIVSFGNTRILRIAALFGANASGKTKMLDALQFLRVFIGESATSLKPNDPTGFIPFAFDPDYKNSDGTFEIEFVLSQVKYEYTLRLNSQSVTKETLCYAKQGESQIIFERKMDKGKYFYDFPTENQLANEIAQKTRKNISLISSMVQFVENDEFKKVYDWFYGFLSPLVTPEASVLTAKIIEDTPEAKKMIMEILKSSDLGSIQDIEIESEHIPKHIIENLPNVIKEHFQDESGNFSLEKVIMVEKYGKHIAKIPLEDESAGTRRFWGYSGLLFLSYLGPSCLSIDEMESSLHPELLEQFLSLFLRYGKPESQLFFTTHNAWLMDSGLLRKDEIWLAQKNPDTGASEYYSLADFEEANGPFTRKYLGGKFGAIPSMGMPGWRADGSQKE